jgi:hypothetical protein
MRQNFFLQASTPWRVALIQRKKFWLMLWLVPLASLLGLLMLEGMGMSPPTESGFFPLRGGNLQEGGKTGLVITFSSEINGYLTPCGCSKPMVGGIPRRATLLKQLAKTHTLINLENGDLTKASGRQDELKAETLIDMLNQLGYDALNLGEYDFKLGLPYLQALEQRFRGKMLCGNVVDGSGKPLFDAFTLLEKQHAGHPVKVLVVGLISEQHASTIRQYVPEVQVIPAAQKLERLRQQLSAAADLRILLWHGNQQEAEQIARQHPYFDLIVCAHCGDGPLQPKQVGKTRLVFSGNDAKFVGVAYLHRSSGETASPPNGDNSSIAPAYTVARVEHIRLTEDFKEDADALQVKLGYLAQVEGEALLLQVARRPTLNGDTFAGSRACRPCHSEDYRIWERSKHAKAMQTLVDEKHDKDPECVVCHVVGLEFESGFVSMEKTPHLKDVGCESCHGPARKHVQDPLNNKLGKAGESSCMQCHVPAHSPNFDFQTYWKQIEHGHSLRENK